MKHPDLSFHYHRLRHELGNYALLRLRHYDGMIISMHQSGTHWIKFMLANAMAEYFGVAPPRYNHANDIIGGAKDPAPAAPLPCLKSSHTIAPLLFRLPPANRVIRWAPTVLLVRDVRASLVSNYDKWHSRYNLSFSEFLQGDPAGRRFNSDIWWCIRFLNAWGQMASVASNRFLIIRYEDVLENPAAKLHEICEHFSLAISDEIIGRSVAVATKQSMLKRADPARPPGEINEREADPLARYSTQDRAWIEACCNRYLKYAFGYNYNSWP